MKTICYGVNEVVYEYFEKDILKLDGLKLDSLDITITEIESQADIIELISALSVIKFCFTK